MGAGVVDAAAVQASRSREINLVASYPGSTVSFMDRRSASRGTILFRFCSVLELSTSLNREQMLVEYKGNSYMQTRILTTLEPLSSTTGSNLTPS